MRVPGPRATGGEWSERRGTGPARSPLSEADPAETWSRSDVLGLMEQVGALDGPYGGHAEQPLRSVLSET